jgi:hypothetical protein
MFDALQKHGIDITQCVLRVEHAITYMEEEKKIEVVYEHVIQLMVEPPHTCSRNDNVQLPYK